VQCLSVLVDDGSRTDLISASLLEHLIAIIFIGYSGP